MPAGFRIVKAALARTAFDGEGARLHGGRWNGRGTSVVYTAQHESLAILELLVHLQASQRLEAYRSIRIDFADSLVEVLDPRRLPADWRRSPAPAALQRIGDRWAAEGRSAILRVPSALVPDESIFLVNPRHRHFARIRIGRPRPFRFDPRLG